ncbi:MAG TPA: sugar phosphate nucleotidyltransferase [Chthoniobacterales bacterium]
MPLTLLILAAGMGSRYGGLKQLDPMGPNGEVVMDYSVYDAWRSGYSEVVFVIRRDFAEDFKKFIGSRFENRIKVSYVFQDMTNLPEGFSVPADRTKPWGTGHAILAAREVIQNPFVAINADDFYGQDAYQKIADFFAASPAPTAFAMPGFRLASTLSEHGTVARGICETDAEGYLRQVEELTAIARTERGITNGGDPRLFTGEESCSMNFWGLTPAAFSLLDAGFREFLTASIQNPKAEFYIPQAISEMIQRGTASVKVLPTTSKWFGVTYQADKPEVVASLRRLIDSGEYPAKLW